jgi:dynein heavy chain, axonemal
LQTYARKYQVAIDTLQFKFAVLDEEPEAIAEGPDDGVLVYGLWMEGARFDREKKLMQTSRTGEMYTVSGVARLAWQVWGDTNRQTYTWRET